MEEVGFLARKMAQLALCLLHKHRTEFRSSGPHNQADSACFCPSTGEAGAGEAPGLMRNLISKTVMESD